MTGKKSCGRRLMSSRPVVFILVGGKGERFFPFSTIIPKCLIPVGGKPCVRWIVEDAIKQGFNKIVLCTSEKDYNHFYYEFRDLDIDYSINNPSTGTASELLRAKKFIDGTFVLRYGDDLTDVSYNELLHFHKTKNAALTLAFTTEYRLPVGVMRIGEKGRVLRVSEKPKLGKPSWIGVAVIEPQLLRYFRTGEDIAGQVIPKLLEARERVFAFGTQSDWYDIGNIEHWRKADEYFRLNKSTEMGMHVSTGNRYHNTVKSLG